MVITTLIDIYFLNLMTVAKEDIPRNFLKREAGFILESLHLIIDNRITE